MNPSHRKPKKQKTNRSSGTSKKTNFQCIPCNLYFHTREKLVHHAIHDRKLSSSIDNNECLEALSQCPYCDSYWPNDHRLNLHIDRYAPCKKMKEFDDTMNVLNYPSSEMIDTNEVNNSHGQRFLSSTIIEPSISINVTQPVLPNVSNNRYSKRSSNTPSTSIRPDLMSSSRLFKVSLSRSLSQEFQDDSTIQFYIDLLTHSNLFKNKDQSYEMTFRSVYIEVMNVASQYEIEHESSTLPGYEKSYLFSNISDQDIYKFLLIISNDNESLANQSQQSQETRLEFIQTEDEHVNEIHQDADIHNNVIDSSIQNYGREIMNARDENLYSITELAMIELDHILKGTDAPLYLFDELTSWCQSFSGAFGKKGDRIDSRETFFHHLGVKVNGKTVSDSLKPTLIQHTLPTGGQISITKFDFKANLASLLSNDDLMQRKNLLFDPDDISSIPQEGCDLDDINTGWWHRETSSQICTNDNEILLPLIFFIDGGKVTDRLSIEPIVFTLGIFNRETRNLPTSWRTLGYIENVYNSTETEAATKNAESKARNYHSIVGRLLDDVKPLLGNEGGFKWTHFLTPNPKDLIFKMAIQDILGDCEGLDKLCLKIGGHNLLMKLLCRDCKVPPLESDNPDHICQFISKVDIHNKSPNELSQLSIRSIRNGFDGTYFGARSLTIHECTPPEPLHQTRLGLVKYLVDLFFNIIPTKSIEMMNKYVRYLYRNHSRQSCRDFPDISPFEDGLTNPGTISAEFQYSRLFAIFICLQSPQIYQCVATQSKMKRIEADGSSNRFRGFEPLPPMGHATSRRWFELIQGTLTYYQFLMSPSHSHHTINGNCDGTSELERESLSQHCIRQFLHKFKDLVGQRKGHGLKINKFHQSLHYTRQISKDASLQNIDTGRPESNAVAMYKRLSSQTQLRKKNLVRQVALRHYEDLLGQEARRISNKQNNDGSETNHYNYDANKNSSKFQLRLLDINSPDEEIDGEFDIHAFMSFQWITDRARGSYSPSVLIAIYKRLYLNINDGGCLTEDSRPLGYTEHLHMDSVVFRAHPNYRSEGKEWYDWCNLKWAGVEDPIPSKIIMFLDLKNCTLRTEEEVESLKIELGHVPDDDTDEIDERHNYLTTDKWVVVQSAKSLDEVGNRLNLINHDYGELNHMTSCVSRRIVLEKKYRLVPLDAIDSSCYAIPVFEEMNNKDCVSYIVCEDIRQWKNMFITQYNMR